MTYTTFHLITKSFITKILRESDIKVIYIGINFANRNNDKDIGSVGVMASCWDKVLLYHDHGDVLLLFHT